MRNLLTSVSSYGRQKRSALGCGKKELETQMVLGSYKTISGDNRTTNEHKVVEMFFSYNINSVALHLARQRTQMKGPL